MGQFASGVGTFESVCALDDAPENLEGLRFIRHLGRRNDLKRKDLGDLFDWDRGREIWHGKSVPLAGQRINGKRLSGQARKENAQSRKEQARPQRPTPNGARGTRDIEGKVTRVGASELGSERVSRRQGVCCRGPSRLELNNLRDRAKRAS
jgi:hypothetical protein